MVTTLTYRRSLVRISARNLELWWQTHTHKQTHRQDRLQYTAPLASTQCKYYLHTYLTDVKNYQLMIVNFEWRMVDDNHSADLSNVLHWTLLITVTLVYGKMLYWLNVNVFRSCSIFVFPLHSVLWHCWFGDRKGIWPAKKLDVGLLVVMIWLELCTS